MNESGFQSLLKRAYDAPALSELSAARIRIRALSRSERTQKRRPWLWASGAVALCACAGFTYPIVDANLFCVALTGKLNSPRAFTMTISSPGWPKSISPLVVYVSGGRYLVQGREGSLGMLSGEGDIVEVYPEEHVSVHAAFHAHVPIVELPKQVMSELNGWDVHRRLENRGSGTENGQPVDRFVLSTSTQPHIEVSVIPNSGLPAVMHVATKGPKNETSDVMYQFDYATPKAAQAFEAFDSVHNDVIDKTHPAAVVKALEAQSLLTANLGRDELRVYDFERLPSGEVFLAYTFSGYHDGQTGSFLRLRDRVGHEWIPEYVDMSQSFKLGGHTPVGEVFFPPLGVSSEPTELFTRQNDWEIVQEIALDPLPETGTVRHDLGSLRAKVLTRPPDWFYFNFGNWPWRNYQLAGMVLQAHKAVDQGQFAAAAASDLKALSLVDTTVFPILFTRTRVLYDLGRAYTGLGQHAEARKYLTQAAKIAKEYPGFEQALERDLAAACRREGLKG